MICWWVNSPSANWLVKLWTADSENNNDIMNNNHNNAVNLSRLRWSPTAQSTAMFLSSWASWAAGNWRRRPGMFEHLRFYSNGFPLWCNDLILFFCTKVLLMMTGQSTVHYNNNYYYNYNYTKFIKRRNAVRRLQRRDWLGSGAV